jgi:hypothetical protein
MLMADFSSCVSFGLMAAALIPMLALVNSTPDRIPADVIAEELEQETKIKGTSINNSGTPVQIKA